MGRPERLTGLYEVSGDSHSRLPYPEKQAKLESIQSWRLIR